MKPTQGDIALVPVPFTDLTSTRRRPVVVISNDVYHTTTQDFVCVAMTSNLALTKYSFIISQGDLERGKLNRPGRVRVDKIYTLAQGLIVNSFGGVDQKTLDEIRRILIDLCK